MFSNKEHFFEIDLSSLSEILSWIIKMAKDFGFCEKDIKKIELASEEALVNIFIHGYKKKRGFILLKVFQDENFWELHIRDQACFFEGLIAKARRIPDVDKGEGVGLVLISKLMDEIEYVKEDGYNVLILKKRKR